MSYTVTEREGCTLITGPVSDPRQKTARVDAKSRCAMPIVVPVIHHLDDETTLREVAVAADCGAQGVALISHNGKDAAVARLSSQAKHAHPALWVGFNLLSTPATDAVMLACRERLDFVWADSMGVSSRGLNLEGLALQRIAQAHPQLRLLASVAFKYQPVDPDPAAAAAQADQAGFLATTSGDATGNAPTLEKIRSMSIATQGRLAVASGMTPENVANYAPLLSHILVSTGVCRDFHHLDPARLRRLIEAANVACIDFTNH